MERVGGNRVKGMEKRWGERGIGERGRGIVNSGGELYVITNMLLTSSVLEEGLSALFMCIYVRMYIFGMDIFANMK